MFPANWDEAMPAPALPGAALPVRPELDEVTWLEAELVEEPPRSDDRV
jgi:hypothetical protein